MAKQNDEKTAPASRSAALRPPFTLKPSKRLCLVLGGVMGLTFAGGTGLYVWQSGQIAQTGKRVATRLEEARASERTAAQLNSLLGEQSAMRTELRYLETSVAPGEYVPTLLRQTEQLAKSVHLQVAGIRPTLELAPLPPPDKEARKKFKPWPYDKVHLDVEVRGGYWDVAKLLYRLTEFPKILAVESVQVQPANGAGTAIVPGSSPPLAATLKLTGYLFKNESQEKSDAKKAADASGATPRTTKETAG